MHTHEPFPVHAYDEPLYKRVIYYLLLFMIGFVPGLVTGYLIGG